MNAVALGVALPLMILGWALVILIGGVVAFSVYAILAGNREEKQYKTSTLPGMEMMQELKDDDAAMERDDNSLESIDLDSIPTNAPLPTPVPAATGSLPSPATGMDSAGAATGISLPTPAGLPGYGEPEPTPVPSPMPVPDFGDQYTRRPTTQDAWQPTPSPAPQTGGQQFAGDAGSPSVLSALDSMINANGSGTGEAQAPVNPFQGRL